MLKPLFSIILVLMLLYAPGPAPGSSPQTRDAQTRIAKIKSDVAKRGVGEKARVTVKLQDGSKLKGYISESRDDSFTLTDSQTLQTRTLAYAEVAEVKKPGGLSLAAKLGIGAGIAVGGLALLYAIGCGNDPYC